MAERNRAGDQSVTENNFNPTRRAEEAARRRRRLRQEMLAQRPRADSSGIEDGTVRLI